MRGGTANRLAVMLGIACGASACSRSGFGIEWPGDASSWEAFADGMPPGADAGADESGDGPGFGDPVAGDALAADDGWAPGDDPPTGDPSPGDVDGDAIGGDGAGADPPASSSVIFVTTAVFRGGFGVSDGGLAFADAQCQSLAAAAGLAGIFTALLSDSTTNAVDRVAPIVYPAVDVLGQVVKSSNIWDGAGLEAPILHQDGTARVAAAWTGSTHRGTVGASHCNDWITSQSTTRGVAGFDEVGANWIGHGGNGTVCTQELSLYCVQTGGF